MSTGYVIPLDPQELANRFPSYDPREDDAYLDSIDEEVFGVSSEELEDELEELESCLENQGEDIHSVLPLLEFIPEREADVIQLYFLNSKRQADIATIFGVTQAAISYRLVRGIKRIRFLLSIPRVSEEALRRDLPEVFPPSNKDREEGRNINVDILVGMWRTTCQSEVASTLKLTQGRVRHRFFKAVEKLREAAERDKKYEPYSDIFSAISDKNFNILRAVVLPQWSGKGQDCCM